LRNTDPVLIELQKARVRLLLEWPIFGPIILHLELKEVTWCLTAATDGRFFYYNRDFVKQLDREELIWLTAHEVLHCVFNHMFRCGNRNPDIWGMAIDYLVNYTLLTTKDSQGQMIGREIKNKPPIVRVLFDPDYTDDFSAEELYALLERKQVKIQMPLDMHLDGNGGGDGQKDLKHSDGQKGDGPPVLTSEEMEDIRNNIRTTLIQAAQQPNVDPGKIPAGILRMLNKLLEHKIDWRKMLDNVLRSAIKYDYTYMRLSRRFWSTGFILPGSDVQEKVKAAAFLDGSASTTKEMVTDFLSECAGIISTFADFELIIGTFDTEVYNVMTFTPDNADEIYDYPFRGGGGTVPSCCWEYMKEHEIEPHRLLIFTDGYVDDDWGDEDFCDTLFIIHSNPRAKPSYGQVCYYEPKEIFHE
jgi:predicted metal-dependent peptidase